MLFIGIFINKFFFQFLLWIFSNLGSWEKAMRLSFKTWFFYNFYVHFSSINVCAVVFACVVFRLLLISVCFWLGVSGFSVFSVLGACWYVSLYIYILVDFNYFKFRKPTFLYYCHNLVCEYLVCCLKSYEFYGNFYHSFFIHCTSWDHPNYSIVEIGENTKKSPGDLRRLDLKITV